MDTKSYIPSHIESSLQLMEEYHINCNWFVSSQDRHTNDYFGLHPSTVLCRITHIMIERAKQFCFMYDDLPTSFDLSLPDHGTKEEFCGVCETIIQYVGSLLEENATETQIKQALNKVCNFLPSELRGEVSGHGNCFKDLNLGVRESIFLCPI